MVLFLRSYSTIESRAERLVALLGHDGNFGSSGVRSLGEGVILAG